MLVKLNKNEIHQFIDFGYELCLDLSKSCYPTYADGIKTKNDFKQSAQYSLEHENYEIFLFYHQGELCGWINWYYLPEDHYLSCENFAVEKHMELALEEFLDYIKKHFKGYEFYFGCSLKNQEAIKFLTNHSFEKLEESAVFLLHFDEYIPKEENINLRQITKERYNDFRKIHTLYDKDMYWNCERILDNIKKWHIYCLYEKESPLAVIYFILNNDIMEIFGIDYIDQIYHNDQFETLMTKALNEGKKLGAKHLYYFAEVEETASLTKLVCNQFDTYVCFKKNIELSDVGE